jgi:alkylhydroperoxidase family enzyme
MLLQFAGGSAEAADAAEAADVDALDIEYRFKELLRVCVKATLHAYKVTDDDFDRLRSTGLDDAEILEGVFVACTFNMVDRLADTLGLYELGQLSEA